MQQVYWDDWKAFITQRRLSPLICIVLDQAGPLLPLVSQCMFLGLPFMKLLPGSNHYQALINTLSDENSINDFSHFLKEAGG